MLKSTNLLGFDSWEGELIILTYYTNHLSLRTTKFAPLVFCIFDILLSIAAKASLSCINRNSADYMIDVNMRKLLRNCTM